MDTHRFDALTRALSASSRRGLLGTLLTLPVLGGLLAVLGVDDADAKGRRKRRKKRHKHGKGNGRHRKGKRKGNCRPKSRAKICANRCGIVKNKQTCKKKVDCGSCACDPAACLAAGGCCDGINCEAVDFQTDARHCGDCQTVCGTDEVCTGGACCAGLLPTANLQAAIDATPPEGTLTLCAGIWPLTAQVEIDHSLTLIGAGAEQTFLMGSGSERVLQIAGGSEVTIQGLTVTGGEGGIDNDGALTLRGVAVRDNEPASSGGGILNRSSRTVALEDGTRVAGNGARFGGGIRNSGGTVILRAGSVVGGDDPADANTADDDGGGIDNSGTLILEGYSLVAGNTTSGEGGGIYNDVGGNVNLENGSQVSGNQATSNGGGIFNVNGPVNLEAGSHVCENTVNGQPSNCVGFSDPNDACTAICPP